MPTPIAFDPAIGQQFIKYARLVAGRGYVHNTLGNIVMRAAHPDFPDGLAYTKHAEVSLEEMESTPRSTFTTMRRSHFWARARRTSSTYCRSIRPSCWASPCISCRRMWMSKRM